MTFLCNYVIQCQEFCLFDIMTSVAEKNIPTVYHNII